VLKTDRVDKVCQKYANVCQKLRKYAQGWESVPKDEKCTKRWEGIQPAAVKNQNFSHFEKLSNNLEGEKITMQKI